MAEPFDGSERDDGQNGHPLESPLWHALGGSLARHSRVIGDVRFLDPELGPVAAMARVTPANLAALATGIPPGSEIVVIAPEPAEATETLDLVKVVPLQQMVAERPAIAKPAARVVELSVADLPQMLALVDITRPGPLGPRSFELGGFHGIFDGDRLVALAGRRLQFDGHAEVSTVCTHPDYRGRDYAKSVVSSVMQGILDSGRTPFLGVNADNLPAIGLYERLGFSRTRMLHISTVRRRPPAA